MVCPIILEMARLWDASSYGRCVRPSTNPADARLGFQETVEGQPQRLRKNGKAGSRKAVFLFADYAGCVCSSVIYRTWGCGAEPILVPITSPDTTNSTRRFC